LTYRRAQAELQQSTGFVSVKPLLSLDALFISTLETLYSFKGRLHRRCALLRCTLLCVVARCVNATVDKHRVTISRVATHTNTAAVAGDSNAQRMCERPLKLYNVLSVDIKSASNDKSGLTETNPVQLLQLCFCMAVGQFCIATCFSKIAHLPLRNTSVHFARKETRSAVDSAWFKLENRVMLNCLAFPIK